MMSSNDVIIIGAGPAGISAAIQLKRSGLNPIVFEKNKIGGLLNNANLVENYPGFPGGISGRELVALFKEQLESFGIDIIYDAVESIDYINETFLVQSASKEVESNAIIVASGTQPKQIENIKISDKIKDRIYYEIADLLETKNKIITIIGAGDAAFDYALNLSKKNDVTILNRGEHTKCLQLLYDRVINDKTKDSIQYITQAQISAIKTYSDNQLTIKYRNNNEDVDIVSDYVIFAIGRELLLDFISDKIKKRIDELEKKDLLHFIGDIKNQNYRQTTIAVGDGVLAAMKIERKYRDKSS
ncbi:MAG: NAD(P)/FAD-dependent oxidoreductase [candidate division Zixibacteria bacterium]|nr:NAD(P)/FAD-dependent oxidoreductase [candidate division Zixibacteria bacterium]